MRKNNYLYNIFEWELRLKLIPELSVNSNSFSKYQRLDESLEKIGYEIFIE